MIEMIIVGAVILGVYAVFGQFVTASWSATAIAGLLVIAALLMFFAGRKTRAAELAKKAAAFALLCVLIIGYSKFNNYVARHRAIRIAAACEVYRAKTGAYPKSLEALVPEYITAVPRAKYTLVWGNFRYIDAKIVYVHEPFLATPAYDLAAAKWGYVPPLSIFGVQTPCADRQIFPIRALGIKSPR